MPSIQKRARELLPNVLLTLLSIVQALALEVFWSRFQTSEHLWQGGWPAAIGWIQTVIIVMGIAEIWLFYVSLIMRFSWVPGVRDMLLPFFIGLLQFTLVDLQGSDRVGAFLLCLAIIFAVVMTESHLIFRHARRDPENRWFFEDLLPKKPEEFIGEIALISAIALVALVVIATGSEGWLAALGLLIGGAALGWQIRVTSYFWRITISEAPEP